VSGGLIDGPTFEVTLKVSTSHADGIRAMLAETVRRAVAGALADLEAEDIYGGGAMIRLDVDEDSIEAREVDG